jgi:hypothetical protein
LPVCLAEHCYCWDAQASCSDQHPAGNLSPARKPHNSTAAQHSTSCSLFCSAQGSCALLSSKGFQEASDRVAEMQAYKGQMQRREVRDADVERQSKAAEVGTCWPPAAYAEPVWDARDARCDLDAKLGSRSG